MSSAPHPCRAQSTSRTREPLAALQPPPPRGTAVGIVVRPLLTVPPRCRRSLRPSALPCQLCLALPAGVTLAPFGSVASSARCRHLPAVSVTPPPFASLPSLCPLSSPPPSHWYRPESAAPANRAADDLATAEVRACHSRVSNGGHAADGDVPCLLPGLLSERRVVSFPPPSAGHRSTHQRCQASPELKVSAAPRSGLHSHNLPFQSAFSTGRSQASRALRITGLATRTIPMLVWAVSEPFLSAERGKRRTCLVLKSHDIVVCQRAVGWWSGWACVGGGIWEAFCCDTAWKDVICGVLCYRGRAQLR